MTFKPVFRKKPVFESRSNQDLNPIHFLLISFFFLLYLQFLQIKINNENTISQKKRKT